MSKQIFFVIGLPRCRTAWLANFLTNGNSFCHHEAMRTVSNLDELEAKLENAYGDIIGDADPTLCPIVAQVMEKFPGAKFVFIRREVNEVVASHRSAFPKMELEEARMQEWDSEISDAQVFPPEEVSCMEVKYSDLDSEYACNQIHEFCLGRPMSLERYKIIRDLRVTTIAEKAYSTLAPWAKVAVSEMSNPLPAACKEFYGVVAEICGKNEPAREWLSELWALTFLWDHVVDGDLVNIAQAELALEAVTLKWPLNAFYQKFGAALVPVLSNALSAWRDGGREREYDIYTEAALAVALCLGGKEWAKQFSPRVRALAKQMRMEDDRKDKVAPTKEAA